VTATFSDSNNVGHVAQMRLQLTVTPHVPVRPPTGQSQGGVMVLVIQILRAILAALFGL